MKLTFIDNACAVIEHQGYRILTDPWLSNGAFEGSWYHYPTLTTRPEDLTGVDAMYISHVHPDHFDPATLCAFPKDIPIVALDHGKNYLHRLLNALGFNRLVTVRDEEAVRLGPFLLTAYKPFATDVFHESKIGNVIDSSLVLEADGFCIFNGNDNNPTIEAAQRLRSRHGTFTAALVKYNAASPYPASFMNLNEQRRLSEAERIRQRNLDYLVALADALQAEYIMPFAGNFVLAGKQWTKNRYLGTTTWDAAAAFVQSHRPAQKTIVLREKQTFDFSTGSRLGEKYTPVNSADQQRYISELRDVPYPYESQTLTRDDEAWMQSALPEARANLWRLQQEYDFHQDYNMYLQMADRYFHFSFANEHTDFVTSQRKFERPYLAATMDVRLLFNILKRSAHWNNVEIGNHIDFYRDPDVYHPDVHVLLSFLHVPARAAAKVG